MKLTNKEILLAHAAFQKLDAIKFPVRTSMLLGKSAATLDKPADLLEKMRKKLVTEHAARDERGARLPFLPDSLEMDAFSKDWLELMDIEEDVPDVTMVKLPEKVAGTCDKCHHNMDRALEIEPEILKDLLRYVEIAQPV